jgi:small subunit ribosomal protein S14
MAKKSSIEKNNRRKRMTKNAAPRRAKLKAIIADKSKPMEERFAATLKLAEMPRNSSATRIRNRCEITGRPRSIYRKNKLSRIALRELGSRAGSGLVKSAGKEDRTCQRTIHSDLISHPQRPDALKQIRPRARDAHNVLGAEDQGLHPQLRQRRACSGRGDKIS